MLVRLFYNIHVIFLYFSKICWRDMWLDKSSDYLINIFL